jgi:hypothetical protein
MQTKQLIIRPEDMTWDRFASGVLGWCLIALLILS